MNISASAYLKYTQLKNHRSYRKVTGHTKKSQEVTKHTEKSQNKKDTHGGCPFFF